jgi:hypothetical protein
VPFPPWLEVVQLDEMAPGGADDQDSHVGQ